MKVLDHTLAGVKQAGVRGFFTGGREMAIRRLLVVHFTAGGHGDTSLDFWKNDPRCIRDDIGAHVLIERDGFTRQCRAFNRTISHAGVSRWKDPKTGVLYKFCNGFSIGIELCDTGNDARRIRGEKKIAGYAGEKEAVHKNGQDRGVWELYSEPQMLALIDVSQAIVKAYNLDDVVGHEDVAPERKTDPGPTFDMKRLREACGFKGLPVVHHV